VPDKSPQIALEYQSAKVVETQQPAVVVETTPQPAKPTPKQAFRKLKAKQRKESKSANLGLDPTGKPSTWMTNFNNCLGGVKESGGLSAWAADDSNAALVKWWRAEIKKLRPASKKNGESPAKPKKPRNWVPLPLD
jgi:hypothetical protein